ncbi:hypothetical protein M378DRAFT_176509 [Amanita muscaria Koide BX008]|uniref:HMG box domain-containing protein n=1 Tax=Amanita muscaria (strain Koide BX008) TaxID=946122 RepID=A0A0C2XHJ8_AMAMK|nr:hypothetical protein M378DRAFT_176509 [Amanita muscaria Koide BX008]
MDPHSPMPKLESNNLLIHILPLSCAMTGPVRSSAVKKHVQPPRPPNAWILYRSEKIRTLPPLQPGEARRAQADVSRMISEMWKNEREEERTRYERMAEQKKAEHQQKYPGYRFQPQKKEEKQRLREIIKQERQTNREARKNRGRSLAAETPTPTFDTPTPPHFTTFYAPETQYGPAGPSPPMSAAPSPLIDNSESDEQVASASQEPNNGQQHTSATIPSLFLDSQQWQPTTTLPSEWTPTLPPIDNTTTEFVSFDVQSFQACTPQPWLANGPSDGLEEALQAFLSATADPSIFHLNNIDVNLLTANPTGEIELSMGQVPLAFENILAPSIPDFSTFDFGVMAGPSSHSLDALAPCSESTDSIAYNADEFLNLDETLTTTFPSIPNPTPSETPPSSAPCSNAYVPPPGAAYSSTRRVGGTWKAPPFIENESMMDHSPPRTSWRVPAN